VLTHKIDLMLWEIGMCSLQVSGNALCGAFSTHRTVLPFGIGINGLCHFKVHL